MKELPLGSHKLQLHNNRAELFCPELDIEIGLEFGVTDKSYNELIPDLFCCVIVTRADGADVTGYTFAFNDSLAFEREISRILHLLGVKTFHALVSVTTNDLLR